MKRANIRDVAERAAVSTATVSRVLNSGKSDVSESLRKKVIKACTELDYKINPSIQDLVVHSRTGRTRNIAYVIVGKDFFSTPSNATVIDGIADANREYNYFLSLVHLTGGERNIYDLPSSLRDGRVDGMLVTGHLNTEVLSALHETAIPHVILGYYDDRITGGVNSVRMNVQATVSRIVQLLMENGKTRVGSFLRYPDNFYAVKFSSALKAFLEEGGTHQDEELSYICDGGPQECESLMSSLGSDAELPFDAIVCEEYRSAQDIAYQLGVRSGRMGNQDILIATSRYSGFYKLPVPAVYFESTSYGEAYKGMKMLMDMLIADGSDFSTNVEITPQIYLM